MAIPQLQQDLSPQHSHYNRRNRIYNFTEIIIQIILQSIFQCITRCSKIIWFILYPFNHLWKFLLQVSRFIKYVLKNKAILLLWFILIAIHMFTEKCAITLIEDCISVLYNDSTELLPGGLVVGVLSSRNHFMQRLAVRNTWAAALADQQDVKTRLIFVLGEEDCSTPPKLRSFDNSCVENIVDANDHADGRIEQWQSMAELKNISSYDTSDCIVGLGIHVHTDIYWKKVTVAGVPGDDPPNLWLKYGEQDNQVHLIRLESQSGNSDWYASNINYELPAGAQVSILLELSSGDCKQMQKNKVCSWDDGGQRVSYQFVTRQDGSVAPITRNQCVPFVLHFADGIEKCPAGWRLFGSNCYYVSRPSDRRTWHAARQACISADTDADLASVHSMEEVDFLRESDLVINQHMWIGMSNHPSEDSFEWADDSGGEFTNWDKYEPNNDGGSEQCVQMMAHTSKWNDNDCYQRYHYICKLPRVPKQDSISIVSGAAGRAAATSAWAAERSSVSRRLLQEQEQYSDLLIVPRLVDTYDSLPTKLKALLQWTASAAPRWWLLKTDDDTLVRVDRILDILRTTNQHHPNLAAVFSQFQRLHSVPQFGKWQEFAYPGLTFPEYPVGSGYLVTGAVVSSLASHAPELRCYQGEDTTMGAWLAALSVPLQERQRAPRGDTAWGMLMAVARGFAAVCEELFLARLPSPSASGQAPPELPPHLASPPPALPAQLVNVNCWLRSSDCNVTFVVAPDLTIDEMVSLHDRTFR